MTVSLPVATASSLRTHGLRMVLVCALAGSFSVRAAESVALPASAGGFAAEDARDAAMLPAGVPDPALRENAGDTAAVDSTTLALNLRAYKDEVTAAALEFGLDQALLRAVIHVESAFNPNAISAAGAKGLMQLMPSTASSLRVTNPFDPTQNIYGGARYLAMLLKQFDNDEPLAIAAYNCGLHNVQKYGSVPPFDETRVYVKHITVLRKYYKHALRHAGDSDEQKRVAALESVADDVADMKAQLAELHKTSTAAQTVALRRP